MQESIPQDVPSRIDLREMSDALEWERRSNEVRPFRYEVFDFFAAEIASHPAPVATILELGSGPGFLAQRLMSELSDVSYVALDFSKAMHELARARLGALADRVEFVVVDFRDPKWSAELSSFDCIVTLQAVHELRHKRHATALHRQAKALLSDGGLYLVCDHFVGDGGMQNGELFMTVNEQRSALVEAGFSRVDRRLVVGSVALHRATTVIA
ncbi:MAG TPA: class I SAM-dependent methyltransferase [Gammaproteobacteria bacterium]